MPIYTLIDLLKGSWHVYYIGKGTAGLWKLGIASGSNLDNVSSFTREVNAGSLIIGGGDQCG